MIADGRWRTTAVLFKRLSMTRFPSLAALLLVAACGPTPARISDPPQPGGNTLVLPQESRLTNVKQLTFGGENAEAYWSFDGKQLIFQSRPAGEGCDQIFRMSIADP